MTKQMYQGSQLRPDQVAQLQGATGLGANPILLGLGGVVLAIGALEGYCLYKVWKSRPGQKDWPWWVLAGTVGVSAVSMMILGGIGTGAGVVMD